MIINADALMPQLKEKVRPTQSDASRHIICPHCAVRTKLQTLADGRRKCTVCGRKFRIHKVTEEKKLRQCAEILLCFCLDFSPHRAAQITHHRYRLIAVYYDHFRRLLTEKSLPQEKIQLLSAHKGDIEIVHDKSRCKWCHTRLRPGAEDGKPPVFGVQLQESGEVTIDPLKDDEAVFHFHTYGAKEHAQNRRTGYAGFICCGKFHRFTEDERKKNDAEQLWVWIRERIRSHHGIWRRNTGYYLKELEWKYNNRSIGPEMLATKLIGLMPADFLTSWMLTTERKTKGTTSV